MIKKIVLCLITILLSFSIMACNGSGRRDVKYNKKPFTNPIAPQSVADPFIIYDNQTQYYYGLYTEGVHLKIYRHRHVAELFTNGEGKTIFVPDGTHGIWGDIWAPDMHKGCDGCWYVYASGRITKEPGEKRIFGLKSLTDDPFGDWEFIGIPAPDVYSIDPTVFVTDLGDTYMCYSRVDPVYGQVLDISKMINPSRCGAAYTIARAELDWEAVAPHTGSNAILEGGFFVENKGRLFLIYSANGCFSKYYALGVLEYIGGDPCLAQSWKKRPKPLLSFGNGVYGPGHASFFRSPDGTELWCAYHGMDNANSDMSPDYRYCHLQRVKFDKTGYPVMGEPIGDDTLITPPSGEKE
ncbi:MAG: family 43 glycosylhydrolase [Clostridia bacterium]|nr:family 43 glycosylhydrolase [Clostridia bacterium]